LRHDSLSESEDGGRRDPVWEHDGEVSVLLCKRAIEPRHGYWTLPAGFNGKRRNHRRSARRETLEEAGARVQLHQLFSMINVPRVQPGAYVLSRPCSIWITPPAIESLEVEMFTETQIPWEDIAFPTASPTR